jgi:GntR family transcriptional repressor for pyruvate dehydrogenase complex
VGQAPFSGIPDPMNKEQETIQNIRSYIDEEGLDVGAQLPSERKMAAMFLTSRNTVRNAIRKLEARGLIEIRKGSGCYLLSRDDLYAAWCRIGAVDSVEQVCNLLEARYLLEPRIGELAARRHPPPDIESLQKCLIHLSRNFIRNQCPAVSEADAEFRRIIADGTGNDALISLMNQFTASNTMVFEHLEQLEESRKDALFADYVEIMNAFKRRDADATALAIEKNIRHQHDMVRLFVDNSIPELNDMYYQTTQ